MAEIISNKFTTTITRATQTTTKEVVSNQFTATISREAQTTTKEIVSNQFTTTISRSSDVPATLGDELSTVVNIYKKGVLLTPVSGTPNTDEYAVTITGTTGCTATLEDDKKTIKLLTITGNAGKIDVSINIENKETYIKSIPVASITGTQQINSAITQTANEITSTVSATYATKNELNTVDGKFDNYGTTTQMNSAINQKANEITSSVSQTYTTKADFNDLSVGGTNLQRFSSPYLLKGKNILDYWDVARGTISHSSDETMGDDCYCLAVNTGKSNCYTQQLSKYRYFNIVEGEKYSYSIDYLVGTNSKGIRVKIYNNGDTKNYKLFEDSKTTTGQTDKIHNEGTWTATWTGEAYVCIFNLGFIDTAGGASNLLFNNIKIEKGSIPTSWSPSPQDINANIDFVSDDLNTNYSTTTQMNSAITQRANSILSTVSETYATKDSIDSIIAGDINLENYPTTVQMNSAINQKANEITSTVSQTYATKSSLKATDDKFANYSTTTQMNSAINQKANEITSTVSETYATKTTTNNMLSQIQQNANSISTKVDVNGVISSINQSSETISINASKINLNGYVSNDNANWSIDNEGNMKAENLKIEGEAGADTLSVNYIDNPRYPATLAGSIDLYINSSSGNDDYTIDDILQSYDEAEEKNNDSLKKKFKTIQGAIDAIPKFLNNKTVYITMETNSTEDVYIRGAVGGAIRIYMNGKTLFGTLRSYACSATITTYGGTKDNTEGTVGIIHPSVGLSFGSRAVSVGFEASQYCAIYKVKVFAPDTKPSDITNTDKVCVASQSGTGSVYCKNVEIVNAVIGFRSNNAGVMHVNSSSGVASKYGFQSATGGIISIANNNQCGGKTSATNKGSGGQIWYDTNRVTFATGNQTTDGGTAPVVSTTKTITIKSSYGDTYRSSVYDNWKKDGTVRQGDYGYGDCTGCWFFGTAFAELKGKTITKVQITIKRQTGGSSVPVEHKLWMHGHTVRPSGAPKLTSGWSQTFRLATGNSTPVAITDSTVLNAISAGTCKGFALRNTYDSAHYSVCSGSVTVKITYTE